MQFVWRAATFTVREYYEETDAKNIASTICDDSETCEEIVNRVLVSVGKKVRLPKSQALKYLVESKKRPRNEEVQSVMSTRPTLNGDDDSDIDEEEVKKHQKLNDNQDKPVYLRDTTKKQKGKTIYSPIIKVGRDYLYKLVEGFECKRSFFDTSYVMQGVNTKGFVVPKRRNYPHNPHEPFSSIFDRDERKFRKYNPFRGKVPELKVNTLGRPEFLRKKFMEFYEAYSTYKMYCIWAGNGCICGMEMSRKGSIFFCPRLHDLNPGPLVAKYLNDILLLEKENEIKKREPMILRVEGSLSQPNEEDEESDGVEQELKPGPNKRDPVNTVIRRFNQLVRFYSGPIPAKTIDRIKNIKEVLLKIQQLAIKQNPKCPPIEFNNDLTTMRKNDCTKRQITYFTCRICAKNFDSKKAFREHEKIHSQTLEVCEECGKCVKFLDKHKQKFHSQTLEVQKKHGDHNKLDFPEKKIKTTIRSLGEIEAEKEAKKIEVNLSSLNENLESISQELKTISQECAEYLPECWQKELEELRSEKLELLPIKWPKYEFKGDPFRKLEPPRQLTLSEISAEMRDYEKEMLRIQKEQREYDNSSKLSAEDFKFVLEELEIYKRRNKRKGIKSLLLDYNAVWLKDLIEQKPDKPDKPDDMVDRNQDEEKSTKRWVNIKNSTNHLMRGKYKDEDIIKNVVSVIIAEIEEEEERLRRARNLIG